MFVAGQTEHRFRCTEGSCNAAGLRARVPSAALSVAAADLRSLDAMECGRRPRRRRTVRIARTPPHPGTELQMVAKSPAGLHIPRIDVCLIQVSSHQVARASIHVLDSGKEIEVYGVYMPVRDNKAEKTEEIWEALMQDITERGTRNFIVNGDFNAETEAWINRTGKIQKEEDVIFQAGGHRGPEPSSERNGRLHF
eukprot:3167230-Pleurochrysis_carterae.AAC.2